MNKLLLGLAMTAVLLVPAAKAAPEIYGKAFVIADYVDQEADYENGDNTPRDAENSSLQLNSHFSRIGFRGSEAITDNTEVIYRLEYGIDIDGDDSRTFQSRDTYLGLKNETYGELRVGRNSSILSYLYGPILNRGYWDNLGTRTIGEDRTVTALNLLDYIRSNHSVLWIAPEYNDLQLDVQYVAGEGFSDSNDEDGYGASLKLNKDSYTLGIAYSKDIEASGSIDTLNIVDGENEDNEKRSVNYGGDVVRGTVTVDIDKYIDIATPVTLGAVFQQADYDFKGSEKEKGLILSSKIGLPNLSHPAFMYIQYNKTDNLNGISNNDSDQLVVGTEYNFKDNIIGHAYIGQNSADYTSPTDPTNSVADIKVFAAGLGIEYLF